MSKKKMQKVSVTRFLAVIFISVGLFGCNQGVNSNTQEEQGKASSNNHRALHNDVILIASGGELKAFDPTSRDTTSIKSIGKEEMPPLVDFDTFKLSPSGKYVVWHSPQIGIMKLNVELGEIERLYKPTDWFNSNAYFEFDSSEDTLYLIDNSGQSFYDIEVESGEQRIVDVPYPFGTLFYISPDQEAVLYVSGFGQSNNKPMYMITSIDGKDPILFETSAELADRDQVVWAPDASGIVTIENKNRLTYYAVDSVEEPEILLEMDEDRIIRLFESNDGILVESADGDWYLIDFDKRAMLANIPAEIASELHEHRLIPFGDRQFMIEETIESEPEQFKRLWLSDFYGNKFVAVPEYQRTVVNTETVPL